MSFTFTCGHCQRPIATGGLQVGGRLYHFECTRPPGLWPTYPAAPTLTEEDIRRIVREELASHDTAITSAKLAQDA